MPGVELQQDSHTVAGQVKTLRPRCGALARGLDPPTASGAYDPSAVPHQKTVLDNHIHWYRWVQRFLPLFQEAARAHRRPVGAKWRVDETYIRLQGKWTYIYRAIDQDGQIVDAYLSERRNAKAVQRFIERAIDETGVTPERVTTDKAKCYPAALRAVLPDIGHRT